MNNSIEELKQACDSDKIIYKEYITIAGNSPIEIRGHLFQTAYKDTHFIGTFNISYVEFEAENNIDYKKKEFDYFKEINGIIMKVGHFYVTEVKDNDSEENVKVTAYDNGLKFANPYKTNLDYASGNITLYKVLNEICQKVGVTLKNTSITNGNFIVDSNQFQDNQSYGDVVSAIAQISGSFATIDENGKLDLRFTNKTDEIIEDYVDLLDKRDTQPITSVSLGMSDIEGENVVLKDQNLINQYGEHWLIINDNPFAYTEAKRNQLITKIFNKVKGFGYSAFESKYSFKPYMKLGDLIKFKNKNGDLVNSIVLGLESNYDDVKLSAKSVTKATIEYQNPKSAYDIARRTEIIVDKQNQKITQTVEKVEGQDTKISQIEQDLGEIKQSISDIADITIAGESSYATIDLDNINESEPISIKVHPTSDNISYLYPNSSLYPSNDLYLKNRKIRFHNKTTNEDIDYTIPGDLLYYDETTYDEFILDFNEKICKIIKRVQYNEDGTKSKLNNEQIINYEYPLIRLSSGDYTISLLGYYYGYISARLMASNIYTDQFATKVDLHSEISQTADEINLEVSKKVGNDEVISKINQTAEAITIDANKININGVIHAVNNNTTTTIDGNKITTGTIKASQLSTNAVTTDKIQSGSINADKLSTNSVTADKIKAGAVNASKVSADIITTSNFSAQNINADKITAGTLRGRAISGGTVSGAKISGGSISINKSGYYFNMGTSTSHPNCSGLNVGSGGINVNNLGFNSNGSKWTFSGDVQAGGFLTYGNVKANNFVANSSINILSGGASGSASRGGILARIGSGHITLDAYNGGGHVYASGAGVSNSKVLTSNGSASSQNVKKNFVKFTKNDYDEAIKLLNSFDIYSYDYKYDLYQKRHQYGFIIDEIEKQKNYQKYFDFNVEKAKVDGEHLDFAVNENDKNLLEVKKYDSNVLDKYLLTCIKAQQQEIEELKQEINKIKMWYNNNRKEDKNGFNRI